MSSCSTEKISADVQEELAASCSNIVLNLGAGYTAPPPTPMASAMSSTATDFKLCAHHEDACEDESVDLPHTKPTLAPTRADLDALALYLMQQSLFSTPTLSLAPSPMAQRKRRSLTCSPLAATAAPSIDVIGTTREQEVNATSIDAIAATTGEQEFNTRRLSNDQYGIAAHETYHYRPGKMSMGFCGESRMGIQRACQEMGAFYITVAVQEYVNFEQMNENGPSLLHTALEHLFLQPQLGGGAHSSNTCVGSGPLVQLSELLISPHHQQTSAISLLQDDDTFQLLADLPLFLEDTQTFQAAVDTNFRETMTKYAKVLLEISKDLIKLLLEDLCVETRANIRGHSLKPLLYIYNNGKDEKSNGVKHDDDVVLSLSHGIMNHQGSQCVSLQAIVGNQLQTWSKGTYKAPNLDSLCNVGSGEVCIQLDLIQHQ